MFLNHRQHKARFLLSRVSSRWLLKSNIHPVYRSDLFLFPSCTLFPSQVVTVPVCLLPAATSQEPDRTSCIPANKKDGGVGTRAGRREQQPSSPRPNVTEYSYSSTTLQVLFSSGSQREVLSSFSYLLLYKLRFLQTKREEI